MNGVCYSFGILYVELLDTFGAGKGETAWIGSIQVGLTNLGSKLYDSNCTGRFLFIFCIAILTFTQRFHKQQFTATRLFYETAYPPSAFYVLYGLIFCD